MSTRKDFLAASSLFALAPAVADAAASAPSPKPMSMMDLLTYPFDEKRFNEILAKPAKHKQCFGAVQVKDGEVLYSMNNSISAYDEFLKEGPGSMQAIAVLYHGAAVVLAMNDEVWNELLAPASKNARFVKDLTDGDPGLLSKLQLGKGNPYLRSATSDPFDVSVERLVSKGSSFFVCHNAMIGLSRGISHAMKTSMADVHKRLMAGIVPGALVVPAGVMAINACQEAKFTYIQSSL